jgi:hypothetical protein
LFDRLALFQSAGIGASCDGTGEVFERIRVGAVWETFARNVRLARAHVTLWLQVAPQRDNVMHLREIVDFAVAEEVGVDLTNFVHWPAELSVRHLPARAKAEAARNLADLEAECLTRALPNVARQISMLRRFLGARSAGR